MLEYGKIDDHNSMRKMYHSTTEWTVNDSDIDKAFGSIHESVMTKIKNYFIKDWIVKQLWKMVLRFLGVSLDENNSIEKWR